MLVQSDSDCGPPERPSGVLDSPILARVGRVLLRHQEGFDREKMPIPRPEYTQSLLSSNFGKESSATVKRGLLWQQRKKLFSRWKERYFILTRDYLYCFQRASGADKITEMGQFLFKIKLSDIERIDWENKKTYSIVALSLGRDGTIFLRTPDGLEDWFELIEECMVMSKTRRRALRHSHDGKIRENNNDALSQRSTNYDREYTIRKRALREPDWEYPSIDNRLSLSRKIKTGKFWRNQHFTTKNQRILTDIDINSYDSSSIEVPSINSYRMTQDVMCVKPSSHRGGMGSFRSTRDTVRSTNSNVPNGKNERPVLMYRERSYSDIQRDERRLWRGPPQETRKLY